MQFDNHAGGTRLRQTLATMALAAVYLAYLIIATRHLGDPAALAAAAVPLADDSARAHLTLVADAPRRKWGPKGQRGKYGAAIWKGREGYTGWAKHDGRAYESSGFATYHEALHWAVCRHGELTHAPSAADGTSGDEDERSRPMIVWLEKWQARRPDARRKKDGKKIGDRHVKRGEYFLAHFRTFFGDQRTWKQRIKPSEAEDFVSAYPGDAVTASKAFNDAGRDDLLEGLSNPFVGLRNTGAPTRKVTPPTPSELVEFSSLGPLVLQDPFKGDMFAPMCRFSGWTGLRPGEAIAAVDDDIDEASGLMHVAATAEGRVDAANRPEPKWGSFGWIILSDRAFDALDERPEPNRETPWMFSYELGEQWHYRTFLYSFNLVAEEFGRPQWTPIYLRHFAATVFHLAGWDDKQIALQFRHHDDGEVVRKHYMHLYEEYERREMRRLLEDSDKRIDHWIRQGSPWLEASAPLRDLAVPSPEPVRLPRRAPVRLGHAA